MEGEGEVRDIPASPSSRRLKPTAEILQEFIKRQQERMTAKQQRIVDEAIEVARAWLDGQLPLSEAMRLTGDGWLRMKIGHSLLGENAMIWQRFVEAIIEERDSECTFGVETTSGFLSMQEITDRGGRIERVYDPVSQQVRCRVRWPHIDLERPPIHQKNDSLVGGSGRSPSMVEWMD